MRMSCFLMVSLFVGEDVPIVISGRILDKCVRRGVAARRPRKLALVRCNGVHLGLTEWRHLFYWVPGLEV